MDTPSSSSDEYATPITTFIKEPHAHDVLCGRGGFINSHYGNKNWRRLVTSNKELYVAIPKFQKQLLSQSIVHAVQSQDPPGRFLEMSKETNMWFEIPLLKAIEKTSQALREGNVAVRSTLQETHGIQPESMDLLKQPQAPQLISPAELHASVDHTPSSINIYMPSVTTTDAKAIQSLEQSEQKVTTTTTTYGAGFSHAQAPSTQSSAGVTTFQAPPQPSYPQQQQQQQAAATAFPPPPTTTTTTFPPAATTTRTPQGMAPFAAPQAMGVGGMQPSYYPTPITQGSSSTIPIQQQQQQQQVPMMQQQQQQQQQAMFAATLATKQQGTTSRRRKTTPKLHDSHHHPIPLVVSDNAVVICIPDQPTHEHVREIRMPVDYPSVDKNKKTAAPTVSSSTTTTTSSSTGNNNNTTTTTTTPVALPPSLSKPSTSTMAFLRDIAEMPLDESSGGLEKPSTSIGSIMSTCTPLPLSGIQSSFGSMSLQQKKHSSLPKIDKNAPLTTRGAERSKGDLLEDSDDDESPQHGAADWNQMKATFGLTEKDELPPPHEISSATTTTTINGYMEDLCRDISGMSTLSMADFELERSPSSTIMRDITGGSFMSMSTRNNIVPKPSSSVATGASTGGDTTSKGEDVSLSEQEKMEKNYLGRGSSLVYEDFSSKSS